ncbi:MAG TPA: helix-turn-helix domain-containing protein [Kofleriaceae bacterium]|jgi:AcrR family transcriptional regulator|nr:helix-turn-helix domain-containing protein [Kofleriaceae bacterium]
MSAIVNLDGPRALRADAQRNYDRLVRAADAQFTEHGADASLEDIAKRAEVGIGTLYRHFPTRDDLIAQVLHQSTAAIVARGAALLDAASPSAALAQWLRALVTYVTTYRGLTAALAASYVGSGTQLCSNCEQIAQAGGALLARAQAAGEIRRDADVREVILTAHSAAWISEQTQDPEAADRLLGILLDGLRTIRPARRARTAPARRPRSGRPAARSSRRRD